MASKKAYDLAVKVGTYEKDGQTKNRYQNVGAIMKGEDGPYLLLDRTFNPAGVPGQDDRASVLISAFKVDADAQRQAEPAPARQAAPKPARQAADDEIPF